MEAEPARGFWTRNRSCSRRWLDQSLGFAERDPRAGSYAARQVTSRGPSRADGGCRARGSDYRSLRYLAERDRPMALEVDSAVVIPPPITDCDFNPWVHLPNARDELLAQESELVIGRHGRNDTYKQRCRIERRLFVRNRGDLAGVRLCQLLTKLLARPPMIATGGRHQTQCKAQAHRAPCPSSMDTSGHRHSTRPGRPTSAHARRHRSKDSLRSMLRRTASSPPGV
jgi:hypothetical protein